MTHTSFNIERTMTVAADPVAVLAAFFDPIALAAWWGAARSVTTPRPLGIYAIEWDAPPDRDELVGSPGGVFYGTVIEFRRGREFAVAQAYWLPPDSDPIGPMALDVQCRADGSTTVLQVRQRAAESGPRWRRYQDLVGRGWDDALGKLKQHLEHDATQPLPSPSNDSRRTTPDA